MPRLLFMICCLGLLLGVTACNTVAGVGEDVSSSARWIKRQL